MNNQLTDKRTISARIEALLAADSVPLSDAWKSLIDDAAAATAELQERRKADEVITATIPNLDPFGVGGKEIKVIYGVHNRCPQCNGTRSITCTCEDNKS